MKIKPRAPTIYSNIHISFKTFNCNIVYSQYAENNTTAIILKDNRDNQVVAVATVNLPESSNLPFDEVYIKNWNENEGIFEALASSGVIQPIAKTAAAGFCIAHLAKIIDPKFLNTYNYWKYTMI